MNPVFFTSPPSLSNFNSLGGYLDSRFNLFGGRLAQRRWEGMNEAEDQKQPIPPGVASSSYVGRVLTHRAVQKGVYTTHRLTQTATKKYYDPLLGLFSKKKAAEKTVESQGVDAVYRDLIKNDFSAKIVTDLLSAAAIFQAAYAKMAGNPDIPSFAQWFYSQDNPLYSCFLMPGAMVPKWLCPDGLEIALRTSAEGMAHYGLSEHDIKGVLMISGAIFIIRGLVSTGRYVGLGLKAAENYTHALIQTIEGNTKDALPQERLTPYSGKMISEIVKAAATVGETLFYAGASAALWADHWETALSLCMAAVVSRFVCGGTFFTTGLFGFLDALKEDACRLLNNPGQKSNNPQIKTRGILFTAIGLNMMAVIIASGADLFTQTHTTEGSVALLQSLTTDLMPLGAMLTLGIYQALVPAYGVYDNIKQISGTSGERKKAYSKGIAGNVNSILSGLFFNWPLLYGFGPLFNAVASVLNKSHLVLLKIAGSKENS